MKVLVAIKRVIDPYVRVRVRADGGGVETDNVKMALNPFCENALEESLRWREAGVAEEVVAASVGGNNSAEGLRQALAMGADRAVWVKTDSEANPEPLAAAKMLAALARRENAGALWTGKQGIDGDFNQTPQMCAALLGWGQALFLSAAEVNKETGEVTAESEVDTGIRVLRVKLPCVLSADLRLNEPRYATLPNIMKAKRKPLEEVSPADLGVDATPRLQVLKVAEPPQRKRGRLVKDAAELAEALRSEAKVL